MLIAAALPAKASINDGQAADLVLGQQLFNTSLQNNTSANGGSLSNPGGVFISSAHVSGSSYTFVADYANNRVLIYKSSAPEIGQIADYVIGQADMFHSAANYAGQVTAYTLNGPRCVYSDGVKLFVCDTLNHRILIWNTIPSTNTVNADVVVGQTSMGAATCGSNAVGLCNPASVLVVGGKLYIGDTSNNRVKIHNSVPVANGAAANNVIGQTVFTAVGQGLHNNNPNTANNPHNIASSVTFWGANGVFVSTAEGRTYVSDVNNNRVLVYISTNPFGRPVPDFVLGQPDLEKNECNYGGSPTAQTLCGPRSVWVNSQGTKLVVTDFSNHRTLIYNLPITANQQAANVVVGQANFTSNTCSAGQANSCQPSGAYFDEASNQFFVAEWNSGVSRVSVFNGFPASNGPTLAFALGQNQVNGSNGANRGAGAPDSTTMFSPNDVKGDGLGRLYVSDQYNFRVLVFNLPITANATAAQYELGQSSFDVRVQNNGGIAANQYGAPSNVWVTSTTLFVSDVFNHRVLGYPLPIQNNAQMATFVLGQSSFTTGTANTGGLSASTLNGWWDWPGLGVWSSTNVVVVSDTLNNRVVYYKWPLTTNMGPAAFQQLGQPSFLYNDANDRSVSDRGLNQPYGLATDDGTHLFVADTSNHRVMVYQLPISGNQPRAKWVIGQSSFTYPIGQLAPGASQCNWNGVSATSLCNPFGVAVSSGGGNYQIYVPDFSNNRVLIWNQITQLAQPADWVLGQPGLSNNACNNGGVSETSICQPQYTIYADTSTLAITDNTNHRVLIYSPPPRSTQAGAVRVLGQQAMNTNTSSPGASPFGMWTSNNARDIATDGQRMAMADYNNHRIMIWNHEVTQSGDGADIVLGQPNMSANLCNNGGVSETSICNPQGVFWDGKQFFVADSGNHRVLVWNGWPTTQRQPADFVVGQAGLTTNNANNGGLRNGFNSPQSPFSDGKNLMVADYSNHRVLFYSLPITANFPQPYMELGQPAATAWTTNGSNQGGISSGSFSNPHGVFYDGEKLYVAEWSNHRVKIWNSFPTLNGQPADFVLGQPDFNSNTCNNGGISSVTLCNPVGLFSDGWRSYVSEFSNHRVLAWNAPITQNRQGADNMLGSSGQFTAGNGCGPTATAICWPYGIAFTGNKMWLQNTWANRILRYTSTQNFQFYVAISSALLPATLTQTTPLPAFKLVVNAPNAGFPLTWTRLTVYNNGPVADNSVQVRLYRDTNSNGVFESGTDTAVGAIVSMNGGKANMNFSQSLDTTYATYFVVANVNPASLPYGPGGFPAAGLRIYHNFNSFRFSNNATEMGPKVPVGLAYHSGTFTPVDDVDSVVFSGTSTITSGTSVLNNSTGVVMMAMNLSAVNDWAFMNTLVFNKVGTADDADVAGVALWRDVNANGALDLGTDVNLMSSSVPFGGGQAFVGPSTPLPLSTTTANLLVVVDFAGSALNKTFGVNIDTSSYFLHGVDVISTAGSTSPFTSPVITLRPAIGYATATVPTSQWWNSTFTFTMSLGQAGVSYFRFQLDTTPTHTWTDTEPRWLTAISTFTPSSSGNNWYLHLRPYSAANMGGNSIDLGPFWFDNTQTSASVFAHVSSTGGAVGEATFNQLSAGVTVQLTIQDAHSGLAGVPLNRVLPNGPAGYWRFDEGSGTVAYDQSGATNTPTFVGAPSWLPGKLGDSLDLDGSTYLKTTHNGVSLPAGNAQRSWAAWVRPTGWSVHNSIVAYGTGAVTNQGALFMLTGNNLPPQGRIRLNFVSNAVESNGPAVPLNQWSHVAATWDGSVARFYINGVLTSTGTLPSGTPNTLLTGPLIVGSHWTLGTQLFQGQLDEVAIYPRRLSDGEVAAMAALQPMTVHISTNAGASWLLVTSTQSYDSPRMTWPGPAGATGAQSFKLLDARLALSTSTAICQQAATCAATNQIKVTVGDEAGNVQRYGPWALLVDTPVHAATVTLVSPANGGYTGSASPTFGWLHPGTTVFPGLSSYILEVSSEVAFGPAPLTISISTPAFAGAQTSGYVSTQTLTAGTTYYWRVRARSFGGVDGPLSQVFQFRTDFLPPVASDFRHFDSTGGALVDYQFTDLQSGISAQISALDTLTGLNYDGAPDAATLALYQFESAVSNRAKNAANGGNPAYLMGGAAWGPGRWGYGASLTGGTAFVAIDSATAGAMNTYSGAFTVQLWIKPNSTLSADTTFIHKGAGNFGWRLAYLSGQLVFAAQNGSAITCGSNAACAAASFGGGQWNLITATYDGVTLRVYQNGLQVAAQTYAGGYGINSDSIYAGAYGGASQFLTGTIDDVRLYAYSRSPAQIAAEAVGSTPPLAMYSNDAGQTWTVTGATYPVTAGAPYIAVTGATGDVTTRTMQLRNISVVQSTSSLTGASATNQIRFFLSDVAGNLMTAGPYAILFDSASAQAVSTPTLPLNGAYMTRSKPSFYWQTAALPSVVQYQLQVSLDPAFSANAIDISTPATFGQAIATYTAVVDLNEGATYYWRVQARTNLNRTGPWSLVSSFTTDYNGPSTSSFVTIGSTGGAFGFSQFNDKAAGVAARVGLRDLISGLPAQATPELDPAAGAIVSYRFDEGAGTSVTDGSGNGYHATIVNPKGWTTGRAGSAAVFATNAYAQLAPTAPIGTSYTIETWFRAPMPGTLWSTLVKNVGINEYAIIANNNTIGVWNGAFFSSGYSLTGLHNGWHHLAAVGNSGKTQFYVDGRFVGEAAAMTSANVDTIGGDPAAEPWTALDDFRVMPGARTPEQIAEDAANGARFMVQYSTTAGQSWTVVRATYAAAGTYLTVTGAGGSTAQETLTVNGLTLAQSTRTTTCAGLPPCSATNQIVFSAWDLAGNYRLAGPYSILVDTTAPVAMSTAVYPTGGVYVSTVSPTLSWVAPSTITLSGITNFVLEASFDPAFSGGLQMSVSTPSVGQLVGAYVSTYTLVEGSTYYWRVRARDGLGNWSPYSQTATFMVDLGSPTPSAFGSYTSSLTFIDEALPNDMSAGTTVQLTVQDSGAGLFSEGGDGYSLRYSTNAGSTWVEVSTVSDSLSATGETEALSGAQFGNRLFVGTKPGALVYSSVDGIGWSQMTAFGGETDVTAMVSFNGKLYAGTGPSGKIFSSANGTVWTLAYTIAGASNVQALTVHAGRLYAAGNDGVFSTADGVSWTQVWDHPTNLASRGLASFNGWLLLEAADGIVRGSRDGQTWVALDAGVAQGFRESEVFNGRLYMVSPYVATNNVYRTIDGVTWQVAATIAAETQLDSIGVAHGRLYVAGASGRIYSSVNGVNFSLAALPKGGRAIRHMTTFLDGLFVGHATDALVSKVRALPSTLTGAHGATTAQTFSALADFTQSLNTTLCAGVGPCAATNQVMFTASDRAGNSRTMGPYAVIVDTVAARAQPIAGVPNGYGAGTLRPEFTWGLQAGVDPLAIKNYQLDLATSLDFVADLVGSSVTANRYASFIFNLTNGATYYWRARAFSVAGATSAYSAPLSIVVDTDTPTGASFLTYDSLGNSIAEAVQLNLNSGVTAQFTIQDPTIGLQRDGVAPVGPSTWTVLLWRLDEGSGGIAGDSSLSGLNGIVLGAPGPTWVNGRHGKALRLDGGGGTGYVHFGSVGAFNVSAVTLSAWINTTFSGWIVNRGDASATAYGLRVEADGTPAAVFGATTLNCAAVTVADGRWHHIAATADGTGRLYVDGAQCATAAASIPASTANLRIGQRGDGAAPFYGGVVDEVRILKQAATAAEIAADYATGQPFTVLVTTTSGNNWQTITRQTAGAAPYISFPGAQGDKTAVALQVRNLSFAPSTTGVTCNAVAPCGATNQLRFYYADRAGNVRSAGPYAVLVDTAMTQPFAVAPPDQSFVSSATPVFSWSETIAVSQHEVQVSTDNFATVNASSVATATTLTSPWTLTHGTTYYWRVRGVDAIGLASPFSPVNSFVVDLVAPLGSAFGTITSTGGLAGETQFNDLATGVTAQLTVQDLVAGLPAPSAGLTADAGTVGLWRLDAGAGTSATDSSGQANHGTLTGGAAWVDGRFNKGVGFAGVQSINVPYAASLNTPAAMTIEAWVKTSNTNAAADGQAVATRWNGSSGFMLTTSRNSTGGSAAFYAGVGGTWLQGSKNVADGAWHHLAATYDGTTARLYVDGAFDAAAVLTNGLANNLTNLSIGSAPGDLQATGFTGTLDEVRLSNFARTATQVQQAYVTGISFYAQVSTNAGNAFTTIVATAPAGSAPYLTLTGAAGSTAAQTLQVRNLTLNPSTSSAVCGGAQPCVGATNQIKLFLVDRAGNLKNFGPFAIQVDASLSQPVAGAPADGAYVSTATPLFSWWERTIMPNHVLQVSTSPVFATLTYTASTGNTSVVSPELSQGTTYYWRVRAQNALGLDSGYGAANQFYVDLTTPTLSSHRVLNSTGGALAETQFTTLATGVTSFLTVQDLASSGLANSTSSFGVMYSTNGGASWIDHSTTAVVLSGTGESYVMSLVRFGTRLYAGTGGSARVYSSADGKNWTLNLSGTGQTEVQSLAVFKGKIYAGTYPGGQVHSSADGSSWSPSLSGTGQTDVRALAVFNNRLYAGMSNGRVYATTDGSSWTLMATLPGVNWVDALTVFNGRLYAGTQPGAVVYSSPDGFNWTSVLSTTGESRITALAAFNGHLFAGTGLNAKIYRTRDGANWAQVYQASGDAQIHTLTAANGKLYAGSSANGRLHVTPDGGNWAPLSLPTGQANIQSLASFNGKLYAGTFSGGRVIEISPISSSLTGSDGSGSAETLTAKDLNFVQSASPATCGGAWACAATQQLVFTAFDRAGNSGSYGPYAVLVDSSVPRPVASSLTPLTTESIRIDLVPVVDGLSGLKDYQFYLSSNSSFAAPVTTSPFTTQSTWTFTGLQQVTTYYVRAAARDNLNNLSLFSVTAATATNGVMFFSTADVSVPTVMQGLGSPMIAFTMSTLPGPAAIFNKVTVTRLGGSDSDITQAEIWKDADADGNFSGGDIQLGAAAFSAGQAQVSLGANAQNVGTSTMTFFVLYRFSPTATIGATIGAQLDDFSAIGFANSYRVPGSFPMATNTSLLLDGPNEVLIAPLSQAPLLAAPGQADVPLLRLRMQTSQGTSVLSKAVLRLIGTAASNEVAAVRVYRDNNSNGSYDATDGLVTNGNDAFVSGVSTLNFTAQTSSVTVSPTLVDYFVTVNVALSATSGNTFGVVLDTGTLVTLTGPDTGYLTVLPASSTLVQVVQPNTLHFAGQTMTPSVVFQGDQYSVLKATLAVDQAFARLAAVTVNRTGGSSDSDVTRVSIWLNQAPPALGGYFNPSVDLRLGTATFSAGKAIVSFSPITLAAGATNVIHVVYELNPLANAGNTIGASLTNSSYLSIVSTATTTVGVFPFASSTATINATVNTLLVPTAQDVTTGGLLQGATHQAMLRLDVRTDRNAVSWSGLQVQKLGTAPDSAISRVMLYTDSNGNFQLDAGTDALVTSGLDVFSGGVANLTFPGAQNVGTSSQTYFLALSVNPLAAPGDTIGVRLATTTAFSLNTPNVVSSVTAAFPLVGGPVPVQQYPNNITVSTASVTPVSAAPGAQNVGMLKLTLNTNVSTARWSGLKVDRVGGTDADVASVKVYYDINQLGVWNASQAAQYLLITSTQDTFGSQATPGTVNLAFSTVAVLTTTPQTFFVVVDLSTSATPANVFAARLLNQNYFTVNAPNAVQTTSAQSGNLMVATPPSLMSVIAVSSAPANVMQSDTNVPILRLSVSMQQYTGQWQGVTILRQGTAADSDVSRVKLFYDNNGNGALDPLLDTLVGTGTFVTGQANLGFNQTQTVTTTPRTYFVAYDVAPVAGANGTIGATIGGPGSFNIISPNGVLNSGFPVNSGLATINATVTGVFVITQDKAPAALMQGATSQVMMSLQMNTTQYSVLWNSLQLTRTGTAVDADITSVRIYRDNNADGAVDGGDTEITSGNDRFVGAAANVVLGSPQAIDTTPKSYLVAVDVYMFAASTGNFGVRIASAASFGVPSPNFVVNTGFPVATSASPIVKKPDTATLQFTDLVPNGINQGVEIAMSKVVASAQRDYVNMVQLRLVRQGTLNDGFINSAKLYLDNNNSGTWDAADVQVGSGTVASGLATINMATLQRLTPAARTYFVTFTFDVNSTVGQTVGFSVPDATYVIVRSPDAVAVSSAPFSTTVAPMLDARTPTMPVVTPDSVFTNSFEQLHYVWGSTVALGQITNVTYAVGTTPGAADTLAWTTLTPIVPGVNIKGLALQSGNTYYISVRAQSSFGFISPTGVSQPILVDLTVPAAPVVNATVGQVSVLLNWGNMTGGPSGLMGYLVEYRTGATPQWRNARTDQPTTMGVLGADEYLPNSYSAQAVGANEVVTGTSWSLTPKSSTMFVRVSAVTGAGQAGTSSTPMRLIIDSLAPGEISDVSSYPNPFDSRKGDCTINYTLPSAAEVTIKIFSVYGKLIKQMSFPAGGQGGIAGANDVKWDGADNSGQKTSKGVYLAVISSGGAKVTHKIAVIH